MRHVRVRNRSRRHDAYPGVRNQLRKIPMYSVLVLMYFGVARGLLSPRCSMAGTLQSDGISCSCLEGWRGSRCSVLDLEPAESLEALRAWAPTGFVCFFQTTLLTLSHVLLHAIIARLYYAIFYSHVHFLIKIKPVHLT